VTPEDRNRQFVVITESFEPVPQQGLTYVKGLTKAIQLAKVTIAEATARCKGVGRQYYHRTR